MPGTVPARAGTAETYRNRINGGRQQQLVTDRTTPYGRGAAPQAPASDPLAELARLIGRNDPSCRVRPDPVRRRSRPGASPAPARQLSADPTAVPAATGRSTARAPSGLSPGRPVQATTRTSARRRVTPPSAGPARDLPAIPLRRPDSPEFRAMYPSRRRFGRSAAGQSTPQLITRRRRSCAAPSRAAVPAACRRRRARVPGRTPQAGDSISPLDRNPHGPVPAERLFSRNAPRVSDPLRVYRRACAGADAQLFASRRFIRTSRKPAACRRRTTMNSTTTSRAAAGARAC